MEANLITVVIPVKNREQLVRRTLESVRTQSAPGFDVILVDNGSSDGSLEVLRGWQTANSSARRPVTVLEESTPGATAARNAGLRAVTTPWVLFFDSDDVMHSGHIQRVLHGIAAHTDADILGWNTRYKGMGIKAFSTRDMEWNNLFEGNFATLRWAARTDLVRRVGAWDEEVSVWDDIELGSRLLAATPRIYHLGPEVTVEVYPQEVSISANDRGDYLQRVEAPLRRIAATLTPSRRIWADYVRMIVAGNTMRGTNDSAVRSRAREYARNTAAKAPSLAHRIGMWGTYHFRRFGLRGQNHILKLFLLRL